MPAAPRTDLYECLGIDTDASQDQIRRAYRKRALQTHPDRLPSNSTEDDIRDASDQFRAVNNAYEVLSNEESRRIYDREGVWPPPSQTGMPPPASDRDDYRPHSGSRVWPHPPSGFHPQPFQPDPFLGSFGFQRSPFGFSDPFEIFNRVFQEVDMAFRDFDHDHRRHSSGTNPSYRRSMPFESPFFRPGPAVTFGHPFDPFYASFNSHSRLLADPFFSPHHSSSSHSGGSRYHSSEVITQTVNGVTHTVKRKIDSDGNEHVTHIYPDGRTERYVNGVERPSSRAPIESSPSNMESTHAVDKSRHEKKKTWWRGG